MRELWESFIADESGQGLTEYVLIIAMIAVGLIVVLGLFRDELERLFNHSINELQTAPGGGGAPD